MTVDEGERKPITFSLLRLAVRGCGAQGMVVTSGATFNEIQLGIINPSEIDDADEAPTNPELDADDAVLMMKMLSEQMVAKNMENVEVSWSLAPFGHAKSREGNRELCPGTLDVEAVFNAQMTATRISTWTLVLGIGGAMAIAFGVGRWADSRFITFTTRGPTLYTPQVILCVGIVQSAVCLIMIHYSSYILRMHTLMWYTNEICLFFFIVQNFGWAHPVPLVSDHLAL